MNKLAGIYDVLLFYGDRATERAYYQSGKDVVGEAMADLGGTEISLRILMKKHPGRDDLIKKLFRYTAEQWLNTEDDYLPPDEIQGYIEDVHPLSWARTNGVFETGYTELIRIPISCRSLLACQDCLINRAVQHPKLYEIPSVILNCRRKYGKIPTYKNP